MAATPAFKEPAWPSSGSAWYSVGLLLAAYTLSYADRVMMSLLIQPIKHDLQLSDVEVSLLIGIAFALVYALMGIMFGLIADRANRRNLIVFGVMFWSLATSLCGVAGSFTALFLARMAVGAGEAALSPAAYSLISDLFPTDRLGKAISVYVSGIPVGSGLALAMGGIFISAIASGSSVDVPGLGSVAPWRLVMGSMIIPGVLLALLFLTTHEPPRRHPAPAGAERGQLRNALKHIWSDRPIYAPLFGGIAFLTMFVSGSVAWIPSFFIRSHAQTAGEIGLYYGLMFGTGGVAGLLTGGIVGDRLVRRGVLDGHLRVLVWMSAVAIIPAAAAPLVPDVRVALLLVALSVFACSAGSGVSATTIQLATPGYLRGRVSAVYLVITSVIGIGFGPTIVAAMTDYVWKDETKLGYSLSLLGIVAMGLATLLLAWALPRYRARLATL